MRIEVTRVDRATRTAATIERLRHGERFAGETAAVASEDPLPTLATQCCAALPQSLERADGARSRRADEPAQLHRPTSRGSSVRAGDAPITGHDAAINDDQRSLENDIATSAARQLTIGRRALSCKGIAAFTGTHETFHDDARAAGDAQIDAIEWPLTRDPRGAEYVPCDKDITLGYDMQVASGRVYRPSGNRPRRHTQHA